MKLKAVYTLSIFLFVLQACSSSSNSPRAVNAPPATNPDGNVTTGEVTPRFDPSAGVLPFPINLLFSGTGDLTLNPPTDDPTNFSDPAVALSALDGFSTTAPWSVQFRTNHALDASTVVPGQTVRVFEVELNTIGGAPVNVQAELQPGVDFVAVVSSGDGGVQSVVIIPLRPLKQITSYMAVITNGVTDVQGNIATADQTYFIAKRTSPLVDANGNSTTPLLTAENAMALEPLRQLVNVQELVAASQGIDPATIAVSWTMTTQSVTPTLQALSAVTAPGTANVGPTQLTTAAAGLAGLADIYVGTLSVPYYLTAPSAANPVAPLNSFWKAAPGAYMPPFDQLGLDPTSTNLTFANPLPVATGTQNIPMLVTVPNATSGTAMPADGWPVMIFQHGITRNRTDMLAVADTMASVGYAVIAIDLPLHGVTDPANPFYIGNTPFAGFSNERTFDLDLVNNTTGAPGPDQLIDDSATHYINLSNLLVSRDNVRQGVADLLVLSATIPTLDINGDSSPDFNGGAVGFTGMSLGAMTGINFLAMGPDIHSAVLSTPGGGIAQLLVGSPTFGPRIVNGLAANGVQQGTNDFNQFILITQTVIDAADPINFGAFTTLQNNVHLLEVIGDQVITNTVPGAPLSGTEPLIAAMGLQQISETTADPAGLDTFVRITEGEHGSIIDPSASPAATVEIQSQMASMILSQGTTVVVTNSDVVQQPQ